MTIKLIHNKNFSTGLSSFIALVWILNEFCNYTAGLDTGPIRGNKSSPLVVHETGQISYVRARVKTGLDE